MAGLIYDDVIYSSGGEANVIESISVNNSPITPVNKNINIDISGKADKTNIASIETTTTASKTYAVGDFLFYNNNLYKVTTAITQSETIVTSGANANVESTTVTDEISSGGGGTEVVANPEGEPDDVLRKLQIGSSIYELKMPQSISSNKDSITFTALSSNDTLIISGNITNLHCESSNSSVAQVSLDRSTITVTPVARGRVTISIYAEENDIYMESNVLEIPVSVIISRTITVHGAYGDTITFTDLTGAKTVNFSSNGSYSNVNLLCNDGDEITFESTKAFDPDDLTKHYKKTVTINSDTNRVFVMPDKCLFWYGNHNALPITTQLEDMDWTNHGWRTRYTTFTTPDRDYCQAGFISLSANGKTNSTECGLGVKDPISLRKLHAIVLVTSSSYDDGGLYVSTSKAYYTTTNNIGASAFSANSTKYKISLDLGSVMDNVYACISSNTYSNGKLDADIYALWYE